MRLGQPVQDRGRGRSVVVAVLIGLLVSTTARAQGASEAPEAQEVSEAQGIRSLADQALADLTETGDAQALIGPSRAMMLRAYALLDVKRKDDAEALARAGYVHRLVEFAAGARDPRSDYGRAKPMSRAEVTAAVSLLTRYPEAGRRLVFLLREGDDPAKAFGLLGRLAEAYPDKLEDYASLAAAVCVVHDRELTRNINENPTTAADPVALFDYYVTYEKQMLFGIRPMPAELLTYVVDSTAPIAEMKWALKEFRGRQQVGKLFFTIEYDYGHFKQGKPKEVTVRGFSLPNIQKYGGVCADQAYFAMAVGKSIGVPTTYTVGRGGQMGHAWVGYFRADRKRTALWDFSEGRYSAYQGVAGVIDDPQTGEAISDGVVALQGKLLGSSAADRELTLSVAEACTLVLDHAMGSASGSALPAGGRAASVEDVLAFLEQGLRSCAGMPQGWAVLKRMAADEMLTLDQKRRWAGVVQKLCGEDCPDFAYELMEPMIATVEDPKQQESLWTALGKSMGRRRDLIARTTMARAAMWQSHNEPEKAAACYQLVIDNHANDGPFVMEAVDALAELLREHQREGRMAQLYEYAWSRCEPPKPSAFASQSNYVRLGRLYVAYLSTSGQSQAAEAVSRKLERYL